MKCNHCGSENPQKADFCQECGGKIDKNKKNKRGFWASINWMAAIIGLIVGLLFCLLTAKTLSFISFIIVLPLISGITSVFLANEVKIKQGLTTGMISIIIPGIIFLPFIFGIPIIVLGAVGGFLGTLLNKYVFNSTNDIEEKSRIEGILNWWRVRGKGVRLVTILIIVILGTSLFSSAMSLSVSNNTQTEVNPVNNTNKSNTTNLTTPTPSQTTPTTTTTSDLYAPVLSGVKSFFKDYNSMYSEDGVKTGYLIDTIKIDSLSKISDNEVQVSISCSRKTNDIEFDSRWSGKFIKKNGEWVEDGNFVQTYSYNKNTKEKII